MAVVKTTAVLSAHLKVMCGIYLQQRLNADSFDVNGDEYNISFLQALRVPPESRAAQPIRNPAQNQPAPGILVCILCSTKFYDVCVKSAMRVASLQGLKPYFSNGSH